MKTIWNCTQAFIAAAGGGIGWLLGGADGFLYTLTVFAVIDYLAGVACAVLEGKLSSAAGARGIYRKVLMFALVGAGHTVDVYLTNTPGVVRNAVIFFFISNEGVSLLENAARAGLPVPQALRDALVQLHDKGRRTQ